MVRSRSLIVCVEVTMGNNRRKILEANARSVVFFYFQLGPSAEPKDIQASRPFFEDVLESKDHKKSLVGR